MNFRLSLCSAAVLLFSSVGCCHLHSCVDPCDPCSRPLAGCGLSNWMHGEIDAWRSRNQCRNSGWSDGGCGCSSCGGSVVSYDGVGNCAGGNCGTPAAGGCSGCAGGSSYPGGGNYIPGGAPTPIPADTAPAPPVPVPASEAAARQMMMQGRQVVMLPQPVVPGQSVQVSWEEFQKLPGTIVSGPGAAAPAPAMVAAPGASPASTAQVPQSTVPPQSFAVPAPAQGAAPSMIVPAAASAMAQQPVIYAPAPGTAAPVARPVQQAAWTPIKQ